MFKAAANWLRKVMEEERFHDTLNKYNIKWQFNLSRAPWWGGQFERLIGIFKAAFYKVIGKSSLTFDELTETVLDVEICMNNRPLGYLEDDVELPVLTPNCFLLQRPNDLPENHPHLEENRDLRKRAKFLQRVKDSLWNRWTREYLTSLRERHRLLKAKEEKHPSEGDIVLIKGEDKNRNRWKMGRVTRLIHGRDQVVRGVQLKTPTGTVERPIQLVYPMERQCDIAKPEVKNQLDAQAPDFRPNNQREE